ncbi:hypothetical protein H7F51_08925 [Novosphingobium flavum]|uniref:Uncharacterized protein n=1 Tax=Novosphingobium flavum TaxID=1778672 RepID=A0A7X1FRJ3_9SPHN|nr:hypothetical protein [Novosphingobium flavum]MBC2665646.1 hypothetical protein [Novosphingobium flavum]
MKVRVFVPGVAEAADGPCYGGTDHQFPALPSLGQTLRFTDERKGDFTVIDVGFVQEGDAFVAAVWLEADAARRASYAEPVVVIEAADRHSERDLNHDVPPDSMPTY